MEIPFGPLGDGVSASHMTLEGLHRVVIRRDSAQARSEALDLAARLDARIAGVLAAR